jgi:hypothetical protein
VGAHLRRIALFLRLFLRPLEVLGHEVLAGELHVVRVMIDPLMVLQAEACGRGLCVTLPPPSARSALSKETRASGVSSWPTGELLA